MTWCLHNKTAPLKREAVYFIIPFGMIFKTYFYKDAQAMTLITKRQAHLKNTQLDRKKVFASAPPKRHIGSQAITYKNHFMTQTMADFLYYVSQGGILVSHTEP